MQPYDQVAWQKQDSTIWEQTIVCSVSSAEVKRETIGHMLFQLHFQIQFYILIVDEYQKELVSL